MTSLLARRSALLGLGLTALAACASEDTAPASSRSTSIPPAPRQEPSAGRSALTAGREELRRIEDEHDAVVGLAAADTTGLLLAHRADSRLALCSTVKPLVAAALLARDGAPDRRVRAWMTAAVRDSDNEAANALLAELGGPAAATAYLRALGDDVTRLDRWEPALNEHVPGDPRDTTSPAALASTYAALLLGGALEEGARDLLTRLMVDGTTGDARIPAAVPPDWRVGDKTGTGGHGTVNDVAVLWPPDREPWVLAVLVRSRHADGEVPESAVAEAAAVAIRYV